MHYSPLLTHLKQVYQIPDKDCAKLIQLFEPLAVKKNEHLLRPGEISRYVYFVEQGCLRQYYINNNGEERTIYFKLDGGWCSELVSFLDNKPTELCVQALEKHQASNHQSKELDLCSDACSAFLTGFYQGTTGHQLRP